MAAVLDADPDVGMVHGDISYADASGRILDRPRWVRYPVGKHRAIERLILRSYIPGAATLYRREALTYAAAPVEAFIAHQDWAMWLDVLLSGWHLYGVPKRVSFYRRHGNNVTQTTSRRQGYADMLALVGLLQRRHQGRLTAGQRRAFGRVSRQARRKIALAYLADDERAQARQMFSALLFRDRDPKASLGLLLTVIPASFVAGLRRLDGWMMSRHSRLAIRLKQSL
jgi:hypothetical protein